MMLHKDLRVIFGDKVAVVLDEAQDGKYAKIQYSGTKQHWVLSSLHGRSARKEPLLPTPRYIQREVVEEKRAMRNRSWHIEP